MHYKDFHSFKYKCNKLTEELTELASVLLQQRNKPTWDLSQEIEDELADVHVWLNAVTEYYNKNAIKSRIIEKIKMYDCLEEKHEKL